ncbi:hypothetical protein [Cellulomonas humilata]|uniref:Membrane protein n=1 Tax=Cellulomonas humilata TaxID=144055 RepID=A0ABU0ED48_9CELL|nr:hypothetical protein [Cellulomonas humilata]MDQ0373190.1 putative membrane protein [Cellulomonas humilata]
MRRTTTTATAAAILLPLLVGTAASPALAADSGDVAVTNTETVQARLSATGVFQGARVYEQLALTGHGTATIENPVSTDGLRNLDGFGGYTVVDGKLVSTLAVDGERRERSLSTYDKDLPLTVEITYTFDGKAVQPGTVVGKSGTLGVHFKVTNVTGKTQDVTYDDGTGTMATASAETVIPMIGQLVTVLPSTFTDVQSDEAGIAGDGRGGTRMQFQMTLFPPIGSATAEFGYTAKVSHAVIPKATLTSMPVSPLEYPSFKGGAASYQAGAQKGVDLTSGAMQIDDSVLKLHDGAAQLLAGLLQLRDGAETLSDGLNDEAAPGAAELSAGLNGKAAPGAARLAAGLNNQLAPGAQQLAAGLTKDAAPGAAALALGAGQLDTGLAQARAKAPELLAGLTQVSGGLANVDAGLALLYDKVGAAGADTAPLRGGLAVLRSKIGTPASPGPLLGGLQLLQSQTTTSATSAATIAGVAGAKATALADEVDNLDDLAALLSDPAQQAELAAIADRIADTSPASIATDAGGLATSLQGSATLAAQLQCGLTGEPSFCPRDKDGNVTPGLLQGLVGIDAGVATLVATVQGSIASSDPKAATLRAGVKQLQAGTGSLTTGGNTLVQGLGDLGAGATKLNAGADSLSKGLATAATGSAALAAGLQDAATGSSTLSAGIGDAAVGSQQLAVGLQSAADGSTQLSDGLTTAADGAPKLVDGTQQLSDEGTSQVVVSGQGTAEDFGVKYAVLSAGAERAQTEGMAYGAPDGAAGSTAYSIEIAGVDGNGASSVGRLILAVVLFAAGIGLATLARRRFV